MTDGLNNPNELSDDDWAMSEHEVPVKKESQPKPIDEKAASLYAPPDTGDLEDWDLSTDNAPSAGAAPPPPPNAPPQAFAEPTAFTPPQKAFEILKPVAPPRFKDEDWGIAPKIKNDGWKMPEPIFRVTEGEILTKVRRSSPKSNNTARTAAAPQTVSAPTAQEQERLPDIYAPPDTLESDSEDFHISDTQEEISELKDLNQATPAVGSGAEQKPAKSKKFLFVILGLLFAGIVVVIGLAAVFGFMFYKSNP